MSAPVLTRLPSGRLVLDTGKVQIGLRHDDPARAELGVNAERIQTALLHGRLRPAVRPPRPLRAEREALARAHGVRGELAAFSDSQLDELDALASAAADGREPFHLGVAGAVLTLVVLAAAALALGGGA